MAKRLAELGALQDAVSNDESSPKRLALAGYIRGLFLDWSANPYNPLSRLTARGRLLGYFWDSGAIGLSMNFADQNYLVKDGTVQSKSFNQIVNFSRTTNATVTNSAGQITYAPHNLLTFSEQFDNTTNWFKTQVSVISNTITAPDGSLTADFIVPNTTTNQHGVNSIQQFTANTYTQTVYAKAGGYNFIILGSNQFANMFAWFNLATGQVGTIQSAIASASITSVGNGWYRCSITSSYGGNTTYRTYSVANADNSFSFLGDGTSGVYLWGAQNEIGSTATTYNTTTVKNLLGYSELFDNAAWTKSNSFVQTNLLTYSEAFDNAVWIKSQSTITANDTLAPNGYQTADKLVETAVSGNHYFINTAATAFASYPQGLVASVYVKAAERSRFYLGYSFAGNLTQTYATFNLTTQEISVTNAFGWPVAAASIESVGNGWYRCSFRVSTGGSAYNPNLTMATIDNSGNISYTGDGTSGIYIWGAQLVQGSVAGDYRRTDAAALPIYYANHNGVVCAEKLVETTATGAHATYGNLVSFAIGNVVTWSIYAKAAERSNLQFVIPGAFGSEYANFNLSTGQVGNKGSNTTASIISLGNGWYRCSATATATAALTQQATINIITSSTAARNESYTGDGTSGIYIFGAQLSDSASLDPYVLNAAAAPTAAAYYGPRFDYDPITLQPKGLLIEEQRTNLLLNSSILGTALGTQLVTVTAVAHTLSFYGTGTVAITGTYTGSLVGSGAYPTRSTLTFTPTAGVITLTVTGTVQFAQLEAGAFATSYIPTAASQVTRAADVATIQGSNFYSWINANEGSIYYEGDRIVGASSRQISISDGTNTNFISLYSSGTDTLQYLTMTTNSSTQVDLSRSPVSSGVLFKQAASFTYNNVNFVLNNGTVASDIINNTMPIVDRMNIGLAPNNTNVQQNQHVKRISYFPQRLSNDVLKGLTA